MINIIETMGKCLSPWKQEEEPPCPSTVVNKWKDPPTDIEGFIKLNDLVRQEIKHEDTLISNRLTALAISQSFLVSAYVQMLMGETAQKPKPYLLCIALLGIALCVINILSIYAALATAEFYRAVLDKLKEKDTRFDLVGKRPVLKSRGNCFIRLAPFFFIFFWIALCWISWVVPILWKS